MDVLTRLAERMRPRVEFLYGLRADDCMSHILEVCARYTDLRARPPRSGWNERDVVLITYADQVRADGESPLATLGEFMTRTQLHTVFRVLHLLPFCPASSDDGFSVIDYRQVDLDFGDWADIGVLGEQFDLMFDLVLNHASCESGWFQQYLRGIEPYARYFIEAHSSDDLSRVVRPRTLPLLTQFDTARGPRQVWTTFSPDQVDLNYREPRVLAEIVDILLCYIQQGARIVRLDAIGFLWKEPGTTCMHLPQTHAIVKLLRDVVDVLAPGTFLLTETNVPHAENISYLGDADEAHLVYNFSLPPLLLDALLAGDGTFLNRWLADFPAPPAGTSFLNFTASHDGIGVRPLESLVPADRLERFVEAVKARGGLVSQRAGTDGRQTPYELNITYFDALGEPQALGGDDLQVRRFMASQALMLSLRGIPAVYFHSLLGTPNDEQGVRQTGRARSINRKRFDLAELQQFISLESPRRRVWNAYRTLLAARTRQTAFHPDSGQRALPFDNQAVVSFVRTCPITGQMILVAANVSDGRQCVDLQPHALEIEGSEIISGLAWDNSPRLVSLEPYQVVWLPVMPIDHWPRE